jgi:hypothetical protein
MQEILDQNTNEPTVTTKSTGIRFGLILAAISVVYFLITSIMGVDMSVGIQKWAMSIVSIVVFVLAHKYFKENNGGFMTYGEGFKIGLLAGVVSSVISAVFTYVYMKFIDPTMSRVIRDRAVAQMEEQGQSEEQIEMAMKFVDMFISPEAMALMTVIFGIIGSVVIALLVSIFTRKENPKPAF